MRPQSCIVSTLPDYLQARKAIGLRSAMEKKVSNLERERKEESLRKVAERARESRIGVRSAPNEGRYK